MKKLLCGLLFIVLSHIVYCQPILNRASANNTIRDWRLMAGYNFYLPVYPDTAAANLKIGIDSCGAMIFTYDVNGIWYRQCSPKKWILLSNGNAPVYTADRGVQIITSDVIRLADTVEGAGTKFQWLYDKAAFRVGLAVGTEWNVANIGYGSFAANAGTTASSSFSTAFGQATQSSGTGAFSAGINTISSNSGATSFGNSNVASGQNSFAMGLSSTASGSISMAMGNLTKAIGNGSFSAGVGTYMNTLNGAVFGAYNDTTGYYANNTSTQVATDPIFTIGNGSGVGSRSNAFQMLRNGATKFSSGITTTTDTTTYKPVVMGSDGELRKVDNWGIGAWGLTGNSGTDAATNFLGTIDNNNLVFKTNNVSRAVFNTSGSLLMNATGAQIELNNSSSNDTYLKIGDQSNKYIQLHNNGTGYFRIEYNDIMGGITTYPFVNSSTGTISLGKNTAVSTSGFYIDPTVSASGDLIVNTPYISGLGSGSSLNIGANSGIISGGIVRMVSKNSGGIRSILEYADNTVSTTSDLLLQKAGGHVGIGTSSPTDELHVVGDFKLVNGSQGADKFLTSDANGVSSWKNIVQNLVTNTTPVGNVGAGEDDLMTYSLAANKLANDGDYLEFRLVFTFNTNANSKQITLYFGATDFYTTGAQNQNDGSLVLEGEIIRTGASSQLISIKQIGSSSSLFVTKSEYAGASEDLTMPVTIKATGIGVSNNDIQQILMIEKFVPVD